MGKRAKIYTSPDPVAAWQGKYRTGVEKGAETYRSKIDEMTTNYTLWINTALPKILDLVLMLPPKTPGADPEVNYRLRGAPFAKLFRALSKEYKAKKAEEVKRRITGVVTAVAPTVVAPTAPPV